MLDESDLQDYVSEVVRDPVQTLHNHSEAARRLAMSGTNGFNLILRTMNCGWQSEAHPRDVIEALAYVLQQIAQDDPIQLIRATEDPNIRPDPVLALLTWSLWNAAIHRRKNGHDIAEIIGALKRLEAHPNENVRFAATEGLKALALS